MTDQTNKHEKDSAVVEREGFASDDLGEQSVYDDETEIARRMRRGDESRGDPNERDVAGVLDTQKISPDISSDKERAA